jgi:hypothetical protein
MAEFGIVLILVLGLDSRISSLESEDEDDSLI